MLISGLPFYASLAVSSGAATVLQPGVISDLEAGFTDPANPDPGDPLLSEPTLISDPLVLRWTEASDEADAECQFRVSPAGEWGEVINIDVAGEVVSLLEASTEYDVRVRAISLSGRRGPWSDPVTFTTYTPSIVHKDTKTATFVGATGSFTGFSLATLALDFDAGDLIDVHCSLHAAVSTTAVPQKGTMTGWNESAWDAQNTTQQSGTRTLWKIADGTEDAIKPIDSPDSGATNLRINLIVCSYTVKGEVEQGTDSTRGEVTGGDNTVNAGAVGAAQATAGNPQWQTINIEDAGTDPVLAWSFYSASASDPDQSFQDRAAVAITPDINVLESQTATQAGRSRLKAKIYAANVARADIDCDIGDQGVQAVSSGYLVARVS